MTTVLIRSYAPTDSCHYLKTLMSRCTKTSFLLTPYYICAHRNSDNLHNAAFIGYSLVARVMANEHFIVVLHQHSHCATASRKMTLAVIKMNVEYRTLHNSMASFKNIHFPLTYVGSHKVEVKQGQVKLSWSLGSHIAMQ